MVSAFVSLSLTAVCVCRVRPIELEASRDDTAAVTRCGHEASHDVCEPRFRIWDARGKEGFIDAGGNLVIAPQFDHVTSFNEGMAAVGNGEKWGYVDRTGKLVIPMRWKEAAGFSGGLAAVVDTYHSYAHSDLDYSITLKSCGFIDKSGRYVIEPSVEPRLEQCPSFHEGLAPVCYNDVLKLFFPDFADAGRCGFIDKSGQWAIRPQYLLASQFVLPANFSEGVAPVGLRGSYHPGTGFWKGDFAYIDRSGRKVFELNDFHQAYPFREGLARVVRLRSRIEGELVSGIATVGFIDHTGRLLFKFDTDELGDFFDGRALVKDPQTKRYGYIDKSGKWVIPPNYVQATPFSDGLASVCAKDQSQCGYIDTQGHVILKTEKLGAAFHDGLALQYLHTRTIGPRPDFRNIYGYMNKSGKYVWVSPGGETFFDEKWWRENYIGPPVSSIHARQ